MNPFEQFKRQKYLNLETFRRNGEGMKTPVWFVQDGETLYVSTMANSGKVKRIRNSGKVNVAACSMNGKVNGEWVQAQARELTDAGIAARVNLLLDKKYGLMKKMFSPGSSRQGRRGTILEIKLSK